MHVLNSLMRRFTISTRMIGAIAMVLTLLLLVGGAGLGGMFLIQGQSREFVDTTFGQATHVSELTRHIGNLRRYEKDLIINYERPDEIQRYKQLWAETGKLAVAELRAMEGSGHAELQAAVNAISAKLNAYQAAFEPIIKQVEASNYDNATAINKVAAKAKEEMHALETQLNGTRQLVQQQGSQALDNLNASSRQTLVAFGIALVIACVVVVPLTLLNSHSIVKPIREARALAQAIATGDLTHRVEVDGQDEAADLMRALKSMQDALRKLVGQLRDSSESIQTASSEVASGNQDLSQRTEEAASSLQQTASSMAQLTGTVRSSAEAAAQ
ncbi:MAG: methyl-accepting chemotaxis protein, partial [Pseudomonadota bacterium]